MRFKFLSAQHICVSSNLFFRSSVVGSKKTNVKKQQRAMSDLDIITLKSIFSTFYNYLINLEFFHKYEHPQKIFHLHRLPLHLRKQISLLDG